MEASAATTQQSETKIPRVAEEIAFTPFSEASIPILTQWLENDIPFDVYSSFGQNALLKDKPKSIVNKEFLYSLLSSHDDTLSMLVTIRMSYHSLLNIGYIYLTQINKQKNECVINYLYISKPFRSKDYEFRTFQKIVEFTLNDMRCERCYVWVDERNYLFLALARTLKLKLVKIGSDPKTREKRYCYILGKIKSEALDNYLFRKYAINVNAISPEKSLNPTKIALDNYMNFKEKTQSMYRKQTKRLAKQIQKSSIDYALNISPRKTENNSPRFEKVFSKSPEIINKNSLLNKNILSKSSDAPLLPYIGFDH